MNILNEYPPFYHKVVAAFPEVAKQKYILFTHGHVIYNPAGGEIPFYTQQHEQIHAHQQDLIGKDEWWERYLKHPTFRFEQELEGFRKEYKVFLTMFKDRNERNNFLRFQALMLSSPIYGNLCTMNEAMEKIKV